MAECTWCDKHTQGIFLDRYGLCKACREKVLPEIEDILSAIKHSQSVVENASNRFLRIEHCRIIIDRAAHLRKYAERGMPIGAYSPAELIDTYRTTHDKLIIEQHPFLRTLAASCARAEAALVDFQDIFHVRDVLDSIRRVRELAPPATCARVISFINQKGGVGKTTSTLNLGAGLAHHNKRVLLIDFDPQANLTDGLGIDDATLTSTIYDVLKGSVSAREAIITLNERLAVIPSGVSLSRAEKELTKHSSSIYLLKNTLKPITEYDAVLIDCPPSLGMLTLNALAASDHMIIPVQPEYYALKGLRKVYDVLGFVNRKINPDLRIMGIVGTRYDSRKKLHGEVIETLKGGVVNGAFFTTIRENIAVAEATSFGKSIFDYNPACPGAEDYMLLSREVLHTLERDD